MTAPPGEQQLLCGHSRHTSHCRPDLTASALCGDLSPGTCRAGATCCDARSHSGNSMGNSNIEVGTCKFRQYWFPVDELVPEAPGVAKWGEFSVQW